MGHLSRVLAYFSVCTSSPPSFCSPASWSSLRPSNSLRTGIGVGGLEVLALVVAMEEALVGALVEALAGALVEDLVVSPPFAQRNVREYPAHSNAASST